MHLVIVSQPTQAMFHMAHFPSFRLLLDTIQYAAPSLLGFLLVFFMVVFGFAQAHSMVFGESLEEFRTIEISGYTLLCALLGEFKFERLQQKDEYMGPMFICLYVALTIIIILNMYVVLVRRPVLCQWSGIASKIRTRVYPGFIHAGSLLSSPNHTSK